MSAPTTQSDIDSVLQSFYRNPDPGKAVTVLRHLLATGIFSRPTIFFHFARIMQCFPDVVTAIEHSATQDRELAVALMDLRDAPGKPSFPQPLIMNINGPEVLDFIWSEFTVTGNAMAVMRIISVLDWQDRVRNRLTEWVHNLRPTFFGRKQRLEAIETLKRCSFPIDFDRKTIAPGVDLDLHVALLVRSGELRFDDLPFKLTSEEKMWLAIKCAAAWSLQSFASSNCTVAQICHAASRTEGGSGRSLLSAK